LTAAADDGDRGDPAGGNGIGAASNQGYPSARANRNGAQPLNYQPLQKNAEPFGSRVARGDMMPHIELIVPFAAAVVSESALRGLGQATRPCPQPAGYSHSRILRQHKIVIGAMSEHEPLSAGADLSTVPL
jgi:hypothetical protein